MAGTRVVRPWDGFFTVNCQFFNCRVFTFFLMTARRGKRLASYMLASKARQDWASGMNAK